MSETDAMFEEVQNEGMRDIGTWIEFELDGTKYAGTINNPNTDTQMLTGASIGLNH